MVSLGPLFTALFSTNHGLTTEGAIATTTTTATTTPTTTTATTKASTTTTTTTTSVVVDFRDSMTTFQTTSAGEVLHKIQADEVLILGIILSLWLLAVLSFLRKWSSIRILQPVEPRYRHTPKNLDSVLVVKRAQDSVIYKNYSRKMSVTMVAREKRRLQRMHTVPIMKDLPLLSAIEVDTSPTEG